MFLTPKLPPYDPLAWLRKPFAERSRAVCEAWALDGYGTPSAVYLLYAVKLGLYVAGWLFFCGFTPGAGSVTHLSTWAFDIIPFQKAVLWSMLFEVLGLGCGSGPLTGRYLPPLGGVLYFLRVGTTKLPVFPHASWLGGNRRSALDVLLYAVNAGIALLGLLSPQPSHSVFCALALLLPVMGLRDKTLFLAARGEHYWTTIALFALASDFVPGAKLMHAALWFWAGVSKLNHHFPNVVGVMTSNSPVLRFAWLRRAMYRQFPEDLRPSRAAAVMGHAGTALELAIPLILLFSDGGPAMYIGFLLMLMLHGFITSNVPMGVPLEWNVMMVYGGLFFFGRHADASVFSLGVPAAVLVGTMGLLLPIAGNVWPERVPFLLAMRYYAGNWAYSVWLFRMGSEQKLHHLTKSSGWLYDQLAKLYDYPTCVAIAGKVMAFRLMHLHGRALPALLPLAVQRLEDYTWMDGEIMAGCVLGWNFGDGHLHGQQLLAAVQTQCDFAEGELRCIMVESQPLGRTTLQYTVLDAKTGVLNAGTVDVRALRRLQPWGAVAHAS